MNLCYSYIYDLSRIIAPSSQKRLKMSVDQISVEQITLEKPPVEPKQAVTSTSPAKRRYPVCDRNL